MASETKTNKTARRKMCAIFPTTEEENDLLNLKLKAEEAFCFEQYETAMILLEKFHDKQTAVYGEGSSLVIDIGFEYQGLYLKSLEKVPTETDGNENERPKSYCSKILIANAIREIEGRSGTRGSSILNLLREVFETYWEKHGLDALPTLLVQRQFYLELVTQGQEDKFKLSENSKKFLFHLLRSKLGTDHKLLLDLPNKLGLSDSSLYDFNIAKIANDDCICRARQFLESGAAKLALDSLQPICTTALLEDFASFKEIWRALTLKATAHHVLGETTKCHVDLHTVKELLHRFKAPDIEKADHEKLMRDLSYIDNFQLDLERIAEAENLVSLAETKLKHQPAAITRTKERLAKVLLDSFHNDQAFRILMQVYEEKAAIHGPRHPEVMAVLDTICSPDMMHEFVSSPVLKELKTFLDKECTSGRLPNNSDRITIKARFFRAYLNVIVGDWCREGLRKMVKFRNQYVQIQCHEKFDDVRNGVVRSFDAMITSKYGTRLSDEALEHVLDLLSDGITNIENRHWYVFRCNQLMYLADGNNVERQKKVLEILKQFYTKACTELKPHDPIILHILKSIWIFIEKIRRVTKQEVPDFAILKEASDRLNQVLGPQQPVAVIAAFMYSMATAEVTSKAEFSDPSKYTLNFVQIKLPICNGLK